MSQTFNSTETGAYNLLGAVEGIVPKQKTAEYYVPSEDEWVKAAYHKGGLSGSSYYNYSTQSDSLPVAITAGNCGVGPYCYYNSDNVCSSTPTPTTTVTPTPTKL